jgi:hypothetical protein
MFSYFSFEGIKKAKNPLFSVPLIMTARVFIINKYEAPLKGKINQLFFKWHPWMYDGLN